MAEDRAWPWWPLLPLYPYGQRATVRHTIVPGEIWAFEQLQGILYAVVPIRMTVLRLRAGGLLVYAPVAPTQECLHLVRELEAQYGNVRYILLPTSSGLEHKVYVGPFARCFPQAQVFVAPQQWSFPVDLPLPWLGFPGDRTQVLAADGSNFPCADEFDCALLTIDLGRGTFAEVALCHRATRTLLLTDTIVAIPDDPPTISQLDPYPLLFHARDRSADPIADTPANRRKGWQRIALFAIYFRPSCVEAISLAATVREATQARDRSAKAYFGLFPFRWHQNWSNSFEALRQGGRPLVAPILQTLILPQDPQLTLAWVDRVARWDFDRIVPCHFHAPIAASGPQFRQAFDFLRSPSAADSAASLPPADMAFVRELEATLVRWRIAKPPKKASP